MRDELRLAMRDGEPAYVTAVSRSDTIDGWRDRRADGGVAIDVRGPAPRLALSQRVETQLFAIGREALANVQAQHRAMVRAIAGTPLVGSPVRMEGERMDSELPPPNLGEHTLEVLQGLGIPAAEIDRLKDEKIVGG